MPDISRLPLQTLWTEQLRSGLHNPANWSTSNDCCKLIYVPTGAGFYGTEQMKTFCQGNGSNSIWSNQEDVQTVNRFVDEASGQVFDEIVVNWIQKLSRMEWMLPGIDLPLQKYRLSFVISAQIDLTSQLLKSVRVYWDQGSFLLQSGVLMRSLRSLVRPGSSEALENALISLPINSEFTGLLNDNSAHFAANAKTSGDEEKKPAIGALNNITSILSELPHSTHGPAVMTPQRPATSRALNPALLGSLKLGDGLSAFDSPMPANTRSVKSRNIFFDEEELSAPKTQPRSKSLGLFDKESDSFRPGLAVNKGSTQNSTSHVFDQDANPRHYNPSMQINENYIHQYESQIFNAEAGMNATSKASNLPQTDKILFESHVFDSMKPETSAAVNQPHVATAPPQQPTHILSPEENMQLAPEVTSSTLSRPGMLGHFRGASLGDTLNSSNEEVKFIPSTAIRFDPNRSQIVLGGYCDDEDGVLNQKGSKSMEFHPTSRVMAPPGGKSTIFE